jgi:hypothetical protein
VRDLGIPILSVNPINTLRRNQMTNLQRSGGIAAIVHRFAYVVAMVIFFGLLSPLFTATAAEYVAFIAENHGLMYASILIAYWLPGATVVVMALALYNLVKDDAPVLAQVATVFALIWAALIIGSGNLMLSNFGVIARTYANDPAQAVTLWKALNAVEHGIISDNEIIGSLWVSLLSYAALSINRLNRGLCYLGLLLGVIGVGTGLFAFIPEIHEMVVLFGLGMVAWSVWVGVALLRGHPITAASRQ